MDNFAYGALTLSGRSFQDLSAIVLHRLFSPNPGCKHPVWALPRSLAATYGITVVFSSSGYLDVSVHRVPSTGLCFQHVVTGVFPAGLPHSDICGSQCICHSPQLFAAYHVFHRLLVPRHPPCALHSLTSYIELLVHLITTFPYTRCIALLSYTCLCIATLLFSGSRILIVKSQIRSMSFNRIL